MRQQVTSLFVIAAAAMLLATLDVSAQRVSDAEVQYNAALRKQQVEGDVPGAIKMYQDIIIAKTADRAVKAKALLQLGQAYDTIGQQSESVYKQIIDNFADQPAVVTRARAKLAALHPPQFSALTMKKIEFGEGVGNIVETDGQRAVYWDASRTTLLFGDITGKDKPRVVFQSKGTVPLPFVSRDLTMVLLYFPGSNIAREGTPGAASYAITRTDGTGYREFSLIEKGETIQPTRPDCLSWSLDNRYLAMCKQRVDRIPHLLRISVGNGETVDLLGKPTSGVAMAAFSPDGKFIAYVDRPPQGVDPEGKSIYIISAQGGEPRSIPLGVTLADWTLDGRYLLIGTLPDNPQPGPAAFNVSAIPIQNGQATGESIPVNVSHIGLPRTHSTGGLVVTSQAANTGPLTFLANLDSQDRIGAWKSLVLNANNTGIPGSFPDFSPDGRRIVYVSGAGARVRNLDSGEDRELFPASGGPVINCLWARQHDNIFCAQINVGSLDSTIFSIALETGRAQRVGSLEGLRFLRRLSDDDRKVVMSRFAATIDTLEWEIGTDPNREVKANLWASRDNRWVFSIPFGEGGQQIMIRPVSGGDADRRLLVQTRVQPMQGGGAVDSVPIGFTPDSQWLLYPDKDSAGKAGFYRASVPEGETQRLGDYPTFAGGAVLAISRDGRKFILSGQAPPKPPEFWSLENAIPTAPSIAKPVVKAPAK